MDRWKDDNERKRGKAAFWAGVVLCLCFALPMLVSSNKSTAPLDCKLNPNVASVYELAELPMIGAGRAEAIAEYRQNRKFENVNDLEGVRGIGEKTVRKLGPYLKFDTNETTND